jgi:hypothetical protein
MVLPAQPESGKLAEQNGVSPEPAGFRITGNIMKNWMKGFAFLTLVAALSACGQSGKEYVGSWKGKKYANRSATIERNGDNFVIKVTEPSMVKRGETDTETLPAVYKDGMLEISTGFGTSKVSYVKDTLLMPTMGGSMEYGRVK